MEISRKAFIQENEATCRNWVWSWAFVNEPEKRIIFGAWDVFASETTFVVLKDEWEFLKGRRQPGFAEAKEYARRVLEDGYDLEVFLMERGSIDPNANESAAKIKSFVPDLIGAKLVYEKGTYFALLAEADK